MVSQYVFGGLAVASSQLFTADARALTGIAAKQHALKPAAAVDKVKKRLRKRAASIKKTLSPKKTESPEEAEKNEDDVSRGGALLQRRDEASAEEESQNRAGFDLLSDNEEGDNEEDALDFDEGETGEEKSAANEQESALPTVASLIEKSLNLEEKGDKKKADSGAGFMNMIVKMVVPYVMKLFGLDEGTSGMMMQMLQGMAK